MVLRVQSVTEGTMRIRKAIDGPHVSGKYQRKPCTTKGCNLRTLTPTTEYCVAHFQQLVGKPGLKEWRKQNR